MGRNKFLYRGPWSGQPPWKRSQAVESCGSECGLGNQVSWIRTPTPVLMCCATSDWLLSLSVPPHTLTGINGVSVKQCGDLWKHIEQKALRKHYCQYYPHWHCSISTWRKARWKQTSPRNEKAELDGTGWLWHCRLIISKSLKRFKSSSPRLLNEGIEWAGPRGPFKFWNSLLYLIWWWIPLRGEEFS